MVWKFILILKVLFFCKGVNRLFIDFTLGGAKAVPAGPWSRAYNFGKLGISLLGGGISEAIKQNLSFGSDNKTQIQGSGFKKYLLSEANAEKISIALCKMRGAPLKLGQVLRFIS